MKKNDCSESHRNKIETSIAFANFLGPEQSFHEIRTKDKITAFLDTKIKNAQDDPDRSTDHNLERLPWRSEIPIQMAP